MPYPKRKSGAEICVTVAGRGVTVYGNRQAFKSLAEWMTWIANSKETEHYECHLMWHLQAPSALLDGKKRAVWVLFQKNLSRALRRLPKMEDFDISFMAVGKKDLAELRKFEKKGVLPKNYYQD